MTVSASGHGGTADPDRVGALLPADREDVVDLVAEVSRVTGSVPVVGADAVHDHGSARRALDLAWDDVLSTMSASPTVTATAVDLLRRVKAIDDALLRRDIATRNQLFGRVREALSAISEIGSTAALVAKVPDVVCGLGFDRAIISRVEDSTWLPEQVVIVRDPAWAAEVLAAGLDNPMTVTAALPESEILRRRVSLVVENVQQRESVHKPIADASLSRSYAASPIVTGGEVVGFLHCDCYYQQRQLDETDRQVLATFAEGLGQVLARTLVLDQVGAVRSGLDEMAARLGASGLGASGPGTGSMTAAFRSGTPSPAPAAPPARPSPEGGFGHRAGGPVTVGKAELTRRELEVLRHMAAGDTNARTARRLVISEGTVKSHVKHILRKLGAANRAEAVSLWWQTQDRPGGASA
jgi:DNA-binding CsgD family transcriptional regulator/GAF domain-containing protein